MSRSSSTSSSRLLFAMFTLAVAVILLVVLVEPALAQNTAKDAGNRLGDTIRDLIYPLIGILAAASAIGPLVSSNYPKMLALCGLVVLIMMLVIPNSPMVKIGEETARALGGGNAGQGQTR